MPIHTVQAPDGTEYEVEAPEGATDDQIIAFAKANFQNAQSADPYRHPDGRLTEAGWQRERQLLDERRQREIDETPFMDMAKAGFARSFVTAGQGLKQAGTEAIRNLAGDSTGLTSGENAITRWADRSLAEQQKAIDQERRFSQDMMGTAGGITGNIAGNLSQLAIPGSAAKGVVAARGAILPTTIGGNALQGAVLSGLQPVATGETRGGNAAMGAGLGAAGATAMRGLGNLASWVRNAIPAFRVPMQQAAAGRVLTELAEDPKAARQAIAKAQQQARATGGATGEIIPGSRPTTAELTGDRGLASLQQTLGNSTEFSVPMSRIRDANNEARVEAIRGAFGGADEDAAQVLRDQRDLAARRALAGLDQVSGTRAFNPFSGVGGTVTQQSQPGTISLVGVDQAVNRLMSKNEKRPAVAQTLAFVSALTRGGVRNAEDAYNIRKTIDDLMTGRVGGDLSSSVAARRELNAIKRMLDQEMKTAFPGWRKYLDEYKDVSGKITQVKTGQELLSRSNAVGSEIGDPVLNAGFLRAAGDLDRTVNKVAREESGFKRANASLLTQPQRETVDAVRRDLERMMRTRDGNRAVGSPTMQNLIGSNRAQDAMGGAGLLGLTAFDPTSGLSLSVLNSMRKTYGERTAMLINEAMLDPDRAAEILARTPPEWRDRAIKAFVNLGGGLPSATTATYQAQRPLEIEIVGGRPVPASEFQ